MNQQSQRVFPFFLALLSLAIVFPGLFLSFEDSEIWGITSSRRIIVDPFLLTSAHFKPLFSFIFGSIASLASSDWTALIASRWITMAFAAAGLYSAFSLALIAAEDDSRSSKVAVVFVALTAALPLFLIHFTKARSDNIAASLALMTCFYFYSASGEPPHVRRLVYAAASIAVLLVTPKSIDFSIILGIFFHASESETQRKSFAHRVFLVSPLIVVSIAAVLGFRDLLLRTLLYWVESYASFNFFSSETWSPLRMAVATGPIPFFLLGLGWLVTVFKFRQINPKNRWLIYSGLVALVFILIHSQKYFFFLASRIPFLALGALPGIQILFGTSANRTRGLMVLLVATVFFSAWRLSDYSGFHVNHQKAVYRSLGGYLDRARPSSYWDAIGLFPTKNSVFHYPSPDDRTNDRILEYVEFHKPNLVLRTSKMELLEPGLIQWLAQKYIRVSDQIFIRWANLGKPDRCSLDMKQLDALLTAEKINGPVALFVKSSRRIGWSRIPFSLSSGEKADSIDRQNLKGSQINLVDCRNEGITYAATEVGPWDALPAPEFSQFFGYDGTL